MPREVATLPAGIRITDLMSLGVIAKTFPLEEVNKVLKEHGKESQRERLLPAHVVVYYVIALALYMQVSYREVLRCLLEGVRWLMGPNAKIHIACKSGISQARSRLGSLPMKSLYDQLVRPIAVRGDDRATRGAYFGKWKLVSIDGSTLDVADTNDNALEFGRPGASRGDSAYPQIRFVSLVENGTHVLFGARMGGYHDSEVALSKDIIPRLEKGMLCMADRNFFSYNMWQLAVSTGADQLWRIKKNLILKPIEVLEDGSFLSKVYPSAKDRREDTNGITVRVIEYQLEGATDAEPSYRLITTILSPQDADAESLAALYHERWEIESAIGEFKTHLRGAQIVLRSQKPELVRQEFFGFMLAHFAIRGLMHEAALKDDVDPDEISFVHTIRVIRRKMAAAVSFPPSGLCRIS